VVFQTEPVPFGIRKPLVDLDATSLLGWGVSLWIAATDADVLHAQLSEAAVPIVLPLANGRSAASSPFVIQMGTPSRSARRSQKLLGPPSIPRADA
jgi:hypothetical protein